MWLCARSVVCYGSMLYVYIYYMAIAIINSYIMGVCYAAPACRWCARGAGGELAALNSNP